MLAQGSAVGERGRLRRDLLHRYVRLQQELLDADPMSSTYQTTIQAFRQMGYLLISSGFEDDLDRLLRIRVLPGGRENRQGREERTCLPNLLLLERSARSQ